MPDPPTGDRQSTRMRVSAVRAPAAGPLTDTWHSVSAAAPLLDTGPEIWAPVTASAPPGLIVTGPDCLPPGPKQRDWPAATVRGALCAAAMQG